MEDIISSRQNSIIKHVKSLHVKKYRDQHNEYIVEGFKMVEEALKSELDIHQILISKDYPSKMDELYKTVHLKKIPFYVIEQSLFNQISDTMSPQGVLAVVSKEKYDLLNILNKPSYFFVILDRIQDPGNCGTIIRTIDAAGGDGVILLRGSVDPYNPKTIRSTMGSIFRVPIFEAVDFPDIWELLSTGETQLLVSHLQGRNLFEWEGKKERIALVVGNESKGVSEEIVGMASAKIKIPMRGGSESLNASVAAGILIYEIFRKRQIMDM